MVGTRKVNISFLIRMPAKVALMVYVAVCLVGIEFDLGRGILESGLAVYVMELIPSVSKTAAISVRPESAAIIIFFAWLFPFVFLVFTVSLEEDGSQSILVVKSGASRLALIGCWIMLVLICFLLFLSAPERSVLGVGARIYDSIKDSYYFVVGWGLIISANLYLALIFTVKVVVEPFVNYLKKGIRDERDNT